MEQNMEKNNQQTDPNIKYCMYCGQAIHKEAVICVHCGCAVATAQQPVAVPMAKSAREKMSKSEKRKTMIFAIVSTVLCIAALVLFLTPAGGFVDKTSEDIYVDSPKKYTSSYYDLYTATKEVENTSSHFYRRYGYGEDTFTTYSLLNVSNEYLVNDYGLTIAASILFGIGAILTVLSVWLRMINRKAFKYVALAGSIMMVIGTTIIIVAMNNDYDWRGYNDGGPYYGEVILEGLDFSEALNFKRSHTSEISRYLPGFFVYIGMVVLNLVSCILGLFNFKISKIKNGSIKPESETPADTIPETQEEVSTGDNVTASTSVV